MKIEEVLPPGSRWDGRSSDTDAVSFSLERIKTHLHWIGEHYSTFQAQRHRDPERAEEELADLADSHRRAMQHLARLIGLLLAGYAVDPSKKVPHGLVRWREQLDANTLRPVWLSETGGSEKGPLDQP